ncbi:MAG: hypothetical protein AAFQ94_15270 [Bacteroidota bacterium]
MKRLLTIWEKPVWILMPLIYCFLFTIEGFSQEVDVNVQIQKIRDHFYGVNNNIDGYDEYQFNDYTTAYVKDGFPHKITVDKAGSQQDYYFNAEQELLFIFEVFQGSENRYYYNHKTSDQAQFTVPYLIRWIQPDKTQPATNSEEFIESGLKKSGEALTVYFSILEQILFEEGYEIKPKKVIAINKAVSSIENSPLKVIEVTDSSEFSGDDDEGQFAEINVLKKYGAEKGGPILKTVHETGSDGGHVIASSGTNTSYYDENKMVILNIDADSTHYYGMAPVEIYNINGGKVSSVLYNYMDENGSSFYKKTVYALNDVLLWVKFDK